MSHIDIKRRKPAIAVLILLLACLALAACGSSSTSSSSSTTASASTVTTPAGKGDRAARFAQIRECLQKNGITLPRFTPGAGLQLPKGVSRAQYEAALKQCGGLRGGPGAGAPSGLRLKNPKVKQAFVRFAACLREHGVKVGEPNTSGSGPIFNTTGINTSSAQFRTAEASCTAILRASGLAGGGGPPGGAPTG
jgi:hypothetical protein